MHCKMCAHIIANNFIPIYYYVKLAARSTIVAHNVKLATQQPAYLLEGGVDSANVLGGVLEVMGRGKCWTKFQITSCIFSV